MRIFVTGPTGSGKSTLARQLSQRYSLPFHSLDDIHWVRDPRGDQRRPMDEKLALLEQIAGADNWVIEGVQFKWADAALNRADRIVVIDMPAFRNHFQILKRFCKQRLGLENADYRPSLKTLVQIFGWSADYRKYERELLMKKLEPFKPKTMLVNHPRQALGSFSG